MVEYETIIAMVMQKVRNHKGGNGKDRIDDVIHEKTEVLGDRIKERECDRNW